jgi:type VI protein secretion system component Hcp
MRSILAIAMAFLLAAPSIALADKAKSSPAKDTPKENISINYGKIDYTYRTNNSKPNSGVNVRSAPRSGTRH